MRTRWKLIADPRPQSLKEMWPDCYWWQDMTPHISPRYYIAVKEVFFTEPLANIT